MTEPTRPTAVNPASHSSDTPPLPRAPGDAASDEERWDPVEGGPRNRVSRSGERPGRVALQQAGPLSRLRDAYENARRPGAGMGRRLMSRADFPYRAPDVPGGVEPLAPDDRNGVDFDTEWARSWPGRQARRAIQTAVLVPATHALARPHVEGRDRLAELDREPAVFVANHHSHLDTPVVLAALGQQRRDHTFVAAGADYFFTGPVRSTAAALALNAVPFERQRASKGTLDTAIQLIDDGWSMLIFPEGGRSPDGWGQDFKGGAALIARRSKVPVVPIHLAGTDLILPKGKATPRRATTDVTIGAPIDSTGLSTDALTDAIEHAVTGLADESSTDWYSARKRTHARSNPALTAPDVAPWRQSWERSARNRRRTAPTPRSWPDLD